MTGGDVSTEVRDVWCAMNAEAERHEAEAAALRLRADRNGARWRRFAVVLWAVAFALAAPWRAGAVVACVVALAAPLVGVALWWRDERRARACSDRGLEAVRRWAAFSRAVTVADSLPSRGGEA